MYTRDRNLSEIGRFVFKTFLGTDPPTLLRIYDLFTRGNNHTRTTAYKYSDSFCFVLFLSCFIAIRRCVNVARRKRKNARSLLYPQFVLGSRILPYEWLYFFFFLFSFKDEIFSRRRLRIGEEHLRLSSVALPHSRRKYSQYDFYIYALYTIFS